MNARRRLAYCAAVNIRQRRALPARAAGRRPLVLRPAPARRGCRPARSTTATTHSTAATSSAARTPPGAWTPNEAKLANDDTFHFTNCSPQHQIFNQSSLADRRGLLLWGNLENAVAQLARRFGSRLSVFNGPIFADHDRPYREDFFVPSEYWKLILVKDDEGRPRALAFRLSQAEQIADLPRERFQPDELAPFVPFQIAVARPRRPDRARFRTRSPAFDPLEAAGRPPRVGARRPGRAAHRQRARPRVLAPYGPCAGSRRGSTLRLGGIGWSPAWPWHR